MGNRHRKSFGGAVKQSLFAAEEREDRIDKMGDPLPAIEQTIDFGAIADEALEYQLLDRLSFQRFCGLTDSSSIPDRTTVWTFEQRLREASLREGGFRPQIQRKEPPLGVPSMKEQDRNQRIAKTRARVEHVFGGMGQMGAQVLKTIGLGRARFQLTLRCAVYNMRRVTQLEEAGVRPF